MLRKLLLFIAPLAVLVLVFWMLFGIREPMEPAQPDVVAEQPAAPAAPDPVFILRDHDLATGRLALMIHDGDGAPVVLRESAVIAAQDNAALIGTDVTQLSREMLAQPDAAPVISLYRDDLFIAGYGCATPCTLTGIDTGSAVSAIPQVAQYDSYDDYLAAILAVSEDPNFGFLDLRPLGGLPVPRQVPKLTLDLPTMIAPSTAFFDRDTHSAMVMQAVQDTLPDGAAVSSVEISPAGPAVIGDIDNSAPILRNGAPIPFTDMQYHQLQVQIDGADTLPDTVLDRITELTRIQVDADAAFAAFVAAQLGTGCGECYRIVVKGGVTDATQIATTRPEAYTLRYYDLREAP